MVTDSPPKPSPPSTIPAPKPPPSFPTNPPPTSEPPLSAAPSAAPPDSSTPPSSSKPLPTQPKSPTPPPDNSSQALLQSSKTPASSSSLPTYPPVFERIHFTPITDTLPLQRFYIATRLRDIFKTSYIHVPLAKSHPLTPPPPDPLLQQEYLRQCDIILSVDKTFEAPRRYTVHTELQGTLLSLVQGSAGNFWDLISGSLFADVQPDTLIARVHAFEAVEELWALVPVRDVWPNGRRLEMQPGSDIRGAFGGFVLGVGDEKKGAVGHVQVEHHYLEVELRNCTREQAVVWLALIVAAELETKTSLVQFVSRA